MVQLMWGIKLYELKIIALLMSIPWVYLSFCILYGLFWMHTLYSILKNIKRASTIVFFTIIGFFDIIFVFIFCTYFYAGIAWKGFFWVLVFVTLVVFVISFFKKEVKNTYVS